MTTTIKMGQCQEPILKCLHQHGGSFAAAEVTAEVITSMGAASEGDAGKKSRQAVTNAAFELRQRHCMTSNGKVWTLTGLGTSVATGSTGGKIPARDYKADLVRVRAPNGERAKDVAPEPSGDATSEGDTSQEASAQISAEATEEGTATESVSPPVDPHAATDPAPAATPPRQRRMKVASAAPQQQGVEDPRIQEARLKTECFGGWSSKARPCEGCPVSRQCREGQAAAMMHLASYLKAAVVTDAMKNLHTTLITGMLESRVRVAPVWSAPVLTVVPSVEE